MDTLDALDASIMAMDRAHLEATLKETIKELAVQLKRSARFEMALRQIADDPCLDPEGNAELARNALELPSGT